MDVYEPGQDRNVAALSIMFMCGGFLNFMENFEIYMLEALNALLQASQQRRTSISLSVTGEHVD